MIPNEGVLNNNLFEIDELPKNTLILSIHLYQIYLRVPTHLI